jgi:hypothetical protein
MSIMPARTPKEARFQQQNYGGGRPTPKGGGARIGGAPWMGPGRASPKMPQRRPAPSPKGGQPTPQGKGGQRPTPKGGGTQGLRNHYANLQRQAGTGFTPPTAPAPAPTNPARPNLPGKFGRVDAAPTANKPSASRIMGGIGSVF